MPTPPPRPARAATVPGAVPAPVPASVRAVATPAVGSVLGRGAVILAATLPAFTAALSEEPRVAAVTAAAALAIVVAILRWSPSTDDDERRPVPAAALVLTAALALELFLLAAGHSSWAPALLGPLASATIVLAYLATFGFRATFLLRRIVLVSVLLWQPVASLAQRIVRSSVDPLSDLVHRRLAAIEVLGVADHPWRVFTAMTDRGEVIVITAVLIATAVSRRRLTARRVIELGAAVTVALVIHHVALLTAPIERYDRSAWVGFVTGAGVELLLGGAAAVVAAHLATRATRRNGNEQSPSVTAAPDRDPVLFAVRAGDQAPLGVRVGTAATSVVLLLAIVLRTATP